MTASELRGMLDAHLVRVTEAVKVRAWPLSCVWGVCARVHVRVCARAGDGVYCGMCCVPCLLGVHACVRARACVCVCVCGGGGCVGLMCVRHLVRVIVRRVCTCFGIGALILGRARRRR